jgi:hypothetical protein
MNKEIALYSFLFLAILFILPGIREIIQRKAKIMGDCDEYTTSFIVGIGRRSRGEPTATDFMCHPTNMIALLQILSIDANCFFHV